MSHSGSWVDGLLREHGVDIVVNVAAESHNSLAVLDPGRFFRTNVLGTQTLLDAARRIGVERFHHVSTCEVYGDLPLDGGAAFTEESPYRPRTPYNASKAGADHAVRAYFETFGLPVTITNCANCVLRDTRTRSAGTCGKSIARPNLNHGSHQFPEKVLPLFTTRALDGLPLPVYASKDNRREWIHVTDHVLAIERVLLAGRVGHTYHVGTGDEVSVDQLADLVLDELGRPASLKTTVPDRPGHDRRYLLDSAKIRAELGWAPTVELAAGVRDTVRWYADNRWWWEPLRGRSPVVEDAWTAAG